MIYLLEDDESIRKLVVYALESQGYEAEGFGLPSLFWAAVRRTLPTLVILDVMLPEEDGISVLRKLRRDSVTAEIPVVMLTAKNTEYDCVEGLDAGADDYISKPFGMMELIARIRAVLRRAQTGPGIKEYIFGPFYLCPERHDVRVNGESVTLTYKEFSLLCDNAGSVMPRGALMDKVWGFDSELCNRTLDVHIRTLRAKLGVAGEMITTVRGIGYKFGGEL
ncbi:MAG: response regulator transcription factor [Clostridia bacterium]|nr:response regulator transcription factor [Clostridia bacterium]